MLNIEANTTFKKLFLATKFTKIKVSITDATLLITKTIVSKLIVTIFHTPNT